MRLFWDAQRNFLLIYTTLSLHHALACTQDSILWLNLVQAAASNPGKSCDMNSPSVLHCSVVLCPSMCCVEWLWCAWLLTM